MSHPWFRLWTDMPTDPKWRTIARASGRSVSEVMAVALHMMTSASNAEERGMIDGFEDEDVATALDIDTADVSAIRTAMEGRFLQGKQLMGWAKRQPKREYKDGPERSQRYRDRQKDLASHNGTHRHTPSHAVTPDKKRRDKEENVNPLPPPGGGGVPGAPVDDRTIDMFDGPPPIKPSQDGPPKCPHEAIIALYHEILPMCPRVKFWTDTRQKLLRGRWSEEPERQDLDFWRRFFGYIADSKWLTGRKADKDGKTFLVDLEWIVRPSNFVKICEGRYENE